MAQAQYTTQMLIVDSPLGRLGITASVEAVEQLFFASEASVATCTLTTAPELLRRTAFELDEYFAGVRRNFSVPLLAEGTPFQQAVWAALQRIPYGETRSYKQIAEQIGRPTACRAVGMANNRNPIAILIPCHRVVGHNGAMVGYAGGVGIKEQLLAIERR